MIEPEVPTRSGSTADWAAATAPILGVGEIGIDTDLGIVKIGDGATAFASLPSQAGGRVLRGVATLAAGVATVTGLTGVTTNSVVQATTKTLGTVTVPSGLRATPTAGQVAFQASQATDTSVIQYVIYV